jgi:hypothetical protein
MSNINNFLENWWEIQDKILKAFLIIELKIDKIKLILQ